MNFKSLMGSDRPGHLFAIAITGTLITASGIVATSSWLVSVGLGAIAWEWACTPDVDLVENRKPLNKLRNVLRKRGSGFIKLMRLITGVMWCLVCWAWLPYGWLVGHRSKFSHSLTLGLPCRFCYAVLVSLALCPWLIDWAIANALDNLVASESFAWIQAGINHFTNSPTEATWAILKGLTGFPADLWESVKMMGDRFSVLVVSAIVGDTVHLFKDGYSLRKMIL